MPALIEVYAFVALLAVAAMLVGGLLVAGALVAPVAVGVLPEDGAARFLRAFWPRYYRLGVIGGSALTVAAGLMTPTSPVGGAYGLVLAVLGATLTAGLWLSLRTIPAVNAARDRGDAADFERRHRRVLILTGGALLAGLAFVVALGWVMPGV
jgi:hypothetical protein